MHYRYSGCPSTTVSCPYVERTVKSEVWKQIVLAPLKDKLANVIFNSSSGIPFILDRVSFSTPQMTHSDPASLCNFIRKVKSPKKFERIAETPQKMHNSTIWSRAMVSLVVLVALVLKTISREKDYRPQGHLKSAILKPVSRIFEIGDFEPDTEKMRKVPCTL